MSQKFIPAWKCVGVKVDAPEGLCVKLRLQQYIRRSTVLGRLSVAPWK